MADEPHGNNDSGLTVQEAKPKLKRPPLYRVMILNDDFTPMEFVVHVLEYFFVMDREKAVRVMLQVHTQGSGVCGVYSREIAETKVSQVNDYSRDNNHPLLAFVATAEPRAKRRSMAGPCLPRSRGPVEHLGSPPSGPARQVGRLGGGQGG